MGRGIATGCGDSEAGAEDAAARLRARLRDGPVLVFDGATGTELERRGISTGLPLWSTHALIDAPDVVAAIHRDYVEAGAEVVTADTFRTQRRTLRRAGEPGERDRALTRLAVALAREAADAAPRRVFVAGSAPPLEDCYRPGDVPDDGALAREHARHAALLAEAGADFALVETMNTIREAVAAARAARDAGLACVVSFVCWSDARLLSGESLEAACRRVADEGPVALGVNCLPPANVPACLDVLATVALPFGVYANLGAPEDEHGFRRSHDESPASFAAHAGDWIRAGARFVGGCCGTTPEHVRALAER